MNMKYPLLLLSFVLLSYSCKKSDTVDGEELPPPDTAPTLAQMIDSAAKIAPVIYLWNKNLPDRYSHNHANLNAFMEWFRNYSIEPGFATPVDRWSAAVPKEQWDNVSSGRRGDFGLDLNYLNGELRIMNTDPNGPAYSNGLRRGDQIMEVNGRTDLSYTQNTIDFLNDAFFRSTNPLNLKVKRGNQNLTMTIPIATYTENPFAMDTILEVGQKKIGYFVYNSFLGDTTVAKNKFNQLFSKFKSANIDDLVIDLRYNSGGYALLSDELANYLIPSGNNGQVLNTDKFNDILAEDFDETVYVSKKGNLDLSKLYIITSANTASASESLINSVNPYLPITLIGDTTHGKPVGYFSIPVYDYYIFPVSIRTINKLGSGNYFNGFAPHHLAGDNFSYAWGDIEENSLSKAIGAITGQSNSRINNQQEINLLRQAKSQESFKKEEYPGYIRSFDAEKLSRVLKENN